LSNCAGGRNTEVKVGKIGYREKKKRDEPDSGAGMPCSG